MMISNQNQMLPLSFLMVPICVNSLYSLTVRAHWFKNSPSSNIQRLHAFIGTVSSWTNGQLPLNYRDWKWFPRNYSIWFSWVHGKIIKLISTGKWGGRETMKVLSLFNITFPDPWPLFFKFCCLSKQLSSCKCDHIQCAQHAPLIVTIFGQ